MLHERRIGVAIKGASWENTRASRDGGPNGDTDDIGVEMTGFVSAGWFCGILGNLWIRAARAWRVATVLTRGTKPPLCRWTLGACCECPYVSRLDFLPFTDGLGDFFARLPKTTHLPINITFIV